MGRNGDRPPWDGDPKEHMGMVEMGSYETNTPWGAMGTDLHGMKTPWGTVAQWGRDPMRPRPHGAQRGPTPVQTSRPMARLAPGTPNPDPAGLPVGRNPTPPTLTEPHSNGGARLPFIALQVLIDGGVGHCLRLDAHGAFVEVAQEGFCVAQQEAEL